MSDLMIPAKTVAIGKILGLAINGEPRNQIEMRLNGPKGDHHARAIYDATTPGYKGDGLSIGRHGEDQDVRWEGMTSPVIAHHRSWTAVSAEELAMAAAELGVIEIPVGGMGETFLVEGIGSFTAIPPGYELAFFREDVQTCRLLVRDPNTPCLNAARALYAKLYGDEAKMTSDFKSTFMYQFGQARGLMGNVIYPGTIKCGDEVRVIRPKRHPSFGVWERAV